MDIQEFLETPVSRRYTDSAARWAAETESNFNELYQLIFSDDSKIAWRAAWAVEKVQLIKPELLEGKISEIIAALPHFKADGSKRSLLLVILNAPIPNPIPVELINLCFDWMLSDKESIAVQVNSMKVLEKICGQEPDLKNEMNVSLSRDLSVCSKGFQATARKVLKKL
jgi:hypothetical protein